VLITQVLDVIRDATDSFPTSVPDHGFGAAMANAIVNASPKASASAVSAVPKRNVAMFSPAPSTVLIGARVDVPSAAPQRPHRPKHEPHELSRDFAPEMKMDFMRHVAVESPESRNRSEEWLPLPSRQSKETKSSRVSTARTAVSGWRSSNWATTYAHFNRLQPGERLTLMRLRQSAREPAERKI
jgi:hypothetical protein